MKIVIPILVFLGACSTGTFDAKTCPFTVHESQVKDRTYRCGYVDVGSGVKVAVLAFKGGAAGNHAPVFYLAGGPSQSWANLGLEFVTAEGIQSAPYDLVFVEQRGTGLSRPLLDCGEEESISDCYDNLVKKGIDTRQFNTLALADDVDLVRSALGYKKIILNGTSYGTTWARAVAARHPESVERVLLDSATSATTPSLELFASNIDGAFSFLFTQCANDATCAGFAPNLEQTFIQTLASLRAAPLKNAAGEPVMDESAFFFSSFSLLSALPELTPAYIQRVAGAVQSGVLPESVEETVDAVDPPVSVPEGVAQYFSVFCGDNDGVTAEAVAANVAKARPEFAELLGAVSVNLQQICEVWPHGNASFDSSKYRGKVLVMAGAFDPRTPVSEAQNTANALIDAQLVIVPYAGHSVQSTDSCVFSITSGFLREGIVRTECLEGAQLQFTKPAARDAQRFAFKRRYMPWDLLR